MASYTPLFTLVIEHGYFTAGVCSCLDFVPSTKTARLFENCGILIIKTAGGITAVYDVERAEALTLYAQDPTEPLEFVFKLYATDPDFKSYSEPFAASSTTILYFDNQPPCKVEKEKIKLHATEYVSKMDYVELYALSAMDILSQKDRHSPPVAVVKIAAVGAAEALFSEQYEVIPRAFCLSFNTRHTHWIYYLLGGMARKNGYILDLDSRIEFEFAGESALADTRIARVFRSKVTVPLQERPAHRFQLREPGAGGGKILIKRLPVASVKQAGRGYGVNEQGTVVSEIYING